ncbi:adenosylcobinamide-GDP ribazoletransferase [Veillonella sp.]|jgi:adenosylcobinamide-GDP ribazoletransferase|uniref:adenosylcobinamide-GDP ribazoletransferase n=1 Tax=Veillonella sp. TaxID=1926307 RepID=UPI0029020BEF|nr:adenosylcobinamide-GDP ribazoletransferase [Veillonella sp.]MDU1299520.1 adenosylcobinamide-GDP ribazoletransferase [Veillonella sp.]MDU2462613.1 adenosylcobinamide-GDP ribazoletransferase [Veillonella sp.]
MTPFFIALQFLTRLKIVNQTEWSVEDFGKSVVAFPYVGLIIGLILALLYGILSPFIPLVPLMLILVIAEFLITGGLHADGLMDTSDGLFSGRERDRKLEIMKDSRIGSFGVVAFVFVTLLKWQLLTAIPTAEFIPMALIMMPLMSRWSLVLSIRSYPYAREQGMGAAFANLAPKHVITYNTLSTFFMPIVILLIGVILYTLLYGVYSIFFIADVGYVVGLGVLVYATLGIFQINIVSMIITYIINRILNHYIVKQLGGTTGDTYGFVVEVTEVLLLLIYIIILSVLSASVASNTTMF